MPKNPPDGCQRVIPYLIYEDAPAAIDFLTGAFGLAERFRMAMPDGRVGHAELALGDSVVMLASVFPEMGHASPRTLPARHAHVVCYVDAHFARARGRGAEVVQEPADQFYGDRTWRARDPEGHDWSFHTHVRDVPHDELRPPGA